MSDLFGDLAQAITDCPFWDDLSGECSDVEDLDEADLGIVLREATDLIKGMQKMLERAAKMVCCTYDNPASMRREIWADGSITESFSVDYVMTVLEARGCTPWEVGRVHGDKRAMEDNSDEQT